MRIAQVVTLLSPDGAYGGPVRVALNQLAALAALGHDVRLFAAYRGYDTPPTMLGGVPVEAFPASQVIPRIGFAGLTSPGFLARWVRDVKSFDVVHIHLARDLLTLPAAKWAIDRGVPTFVQTHGMIDHSEKLLSRPLDLALTKPALKGAATVFYLTPRERHDLTMLVPTLSQIEFLPNGVPAATPKMGITAEREVLFLARLHPRKRAIQFVHAALLLSAQFTNWRFTVVGPDEGEGAEVQRILDAARNPRVRWEGPLNPDATGARMQQSQIYVLPSLDEPFPMSVLEAAANGLPVIITDSCGLAPYVTSFDAGIVIDDSQDQLIAAMAKLLGDPHLRAHCGRNSLTMVSEEFDMVSVARQLEGYYQQRIAQTHG